MKKGLAYSSGQPDPGAVGACRGLPARARRRRRAGEGNGLQAGGCRLCLDAQKIGGSGINLFESLCFNRK